ncbi:MAG: DUF5916 domain-containing protein [Steroidobacteraceae bacterium]|jgi:hypothetical protein|nr:DUF5916 domain-containing protein [Steroidobacteraceae bacterium]
MLATRFTLPTGLLPLVVALGCAPQAAAMTVDGRLDEPEWQQAQRFDDFRVLEPLTREVAEHPATMRVLARPEGLYLAMEASVPPPLRVRGRSPRDAEQLPADPFTFFVDFEGEGRTAYEFTVTISGAVRDGVVANQVEVSHDWDGFWLHGVHETDRGWSAEVMVPWWVAPAGPAGDGPRVIGVYAALYLKAQSRRYAFPAIEETSPSFVQDLHRIRVPRYAVGTLDFYPYAAVDVDRFGDRTLGRAGIDVFWKPDGANRLIATLNPDFGQVESDDLVVNFSATETFFGDKRPFFTEGQQLFDLRFGEDGRLVNTRRVGAAPDAGSAGASDVAVAAKYTGQSGGLEYGLFTALEDDAREAEGRDFLAARLRQGLDGLTLGWLGTRVDRPTLDRRALVNTIDLDWYPRPAVAVQARAMRSDLDQPAGDAVGHGAFAALRYQPGGAFAQSLEFTWLDEDFEINDLGYQERADLRELDTETTLYRRSYPDGHWLSASNWAIEGRLRWNQAGAWLPGWAGLSRGLSLRNGDQLDFGVWHGLAGTDDRITRGNGDLRVDSSTGLWLEWAQAEAGLLRTELYAYAWREEFGGSAWEFGLSPRIVPTDTLSLLLDLATRQSHGWLIWTGGSDVGTFRRREYSASLEGNWFPMPRHELRLKFQWLGLEAEGRAAYSVAGGPVPRRLAAAPDDFGLAQLGIQLRYRFELAPLSDLYVVYGRGGEFFEQGASRGAGDLWRGALDGTTANRFYVKVRYRL